MNQPDLIWGDNFIRNQQEGLTILTYYTWNYTFYLLDVNIIIIKCGTKTSYSILNICVTILYGYVTYLNLKKLCSIDNSVTGTTSFSVDGKILACFFLY